MTNRRPYLLALLTFVAGALAGALVALAVDPRIADLRAEKRALEDRNAILQREIENPPTTGEESAAPTGTEESAAP